MSSLAQASWRGLVVGDLPRVLEASGVETEIVDKGEKVDAEVDKVHDGVEIAVVKEIGANGDEYKTDRKCKNCAHNHR